MTGGACSAAETSVDSALRFARQPWNKQGQQKENDTDGDNTSDKHGQLLRSTQLQRRGCQIGYRGRQILCMSRGYGRVSVERSPEHCPVNHP
jgi:hypothetical protein